MKQPRIIIKSNDEVTLENIEYINVARLRIKLRRHSLDSRRNKQALLTRLKDYLEFDKIW